MAQNPKINGRSAATTMVAAMAVIGVIDNYIAVISQDVSIWQFMIVRGAFALPIIIMLSFLGLGTMRPIRTWAVGLRSLLIAISMLFYFGSLSFMPIAQGLAGLFTSPIFILIITAFILKERIGPVRILAVGLGFVGIILVLELEASSLSWVNFIPVFGGLFYALGSVATRQLCNGESTVSLLSMLLTIQCIMGFCALVILSIYGPDVPYGSDGFLLRGWIWPITEVLPYIVLQSVGSILGIGLIIRAYQIGDASYVAVYEYSVFVFAPLYAWLMFSQDMTLVQASGIALIAGAGVLITLRST
ncbi:DMT family transporter [Paracoccaceae bacterium]|nr:DMT family transporter [Paracoccaceae bacterium]